MALEKPELAAPVIALNFSYSDLYRKQVVKQADLVLAMQLRPEAFTAEERERNFAYYERLTVRDSSLSACTQAVMAAETGHLRLAYDYLGEAAMIDLEDLQHNTRDGLHLASLAGAWIALVEGFGGMRRRQGTLRFAPRLPPALTRLAFTVVTEGRRLRVEATRTAAGYTLLDNGPSLQIGHHGQPVTLTAGHTETREIPALPERPEPGRRSVRRRLRRSDDPESRGAGRGCQVRQGARHAGM